MRVGAEIKRNISVLLSGNYADSVLLEFLSFSLSMIPFLLLLLLNVSPLMNIKTEIYIILLCVFLSFVIGSALKAGFAFWYYHISEKAKDGYGFFVCFLHPSIWIKSILIRLFITVKVIIFTLFAFLIPASFFIGGYSIWMGRFHDIQAEFGLIAYLLGLILSVFAIVFSVIFSMRYSFSFLILAEDPSVGPWKAVSRSAATCKGRVSGLFSFILSFFPLFLCCLLIVPAFFVLPYFKECKTVYGRYFLETEKLNRENKLNKGKK